MRDGLQRRQQRNVGFAEIHQARQVEDADGAIHEVVDVERQAVRRNREALRRAADVEAEDLPASVRVDHLPPPDSSRAPRTCRRRTCRRQRRWRGSNCRDRGAMRSPQRWCDRSMRELIARTVFWKFRFEPIAQRAALDVVLLRGHPGGSTVGRNDGSTEIVRYPAALIFQRPTSSLCCRTVVPSTVMLPGTDAHNFAAVLDGTVLRSARRRFPRPADAA